MIKSSILKIITQALGKEKLTNCYLSYNVIIERIENKDIVVLNEDTVVLLLDKFKGYNKLYYFLSDIECTTEYWNTLRDKLEPCGEIVLSIVGRNGSSMIDVPKLLGFEKYKTYLRKNCFNKEISYRREMMSVENADISDAELIMTMLYNTFDILSDDLPTLEMVQSLVQKKQVYKIVINAEIAGVLLYEDIGVKSYARALCISEKYQNSVLGYSLLAHYFNDHLNSTKLFYLWVDKENIAVLKLHNRFGYKEDGLVENIFIRRGK